MTRAFFFFLLLLLLLLLLLRTVIRKLSSTHLPNYCFHIEQRNALVLASYNELQKVVSQHFENHANVCAVDTTDFEIVEQLDCFLSFRIRFIAVANAAQQLDLVQRRFRIMRSALDHFQSNKTLRPETVARKYDH